MGRFEVKVTVSNPARPERHAEVSLLVDTGATLSWISRELLESLGVQSVSRSRFTLPDGRRLERETGGVLLTLNGSTMSVPVAFAEPGEATILGATALEALGLAVDPVKQRLVPHDLYV